MTTAERMTTDPGSLAGADDFALLDLYAELARLREEVARLEERARLREERAALVVHELRQPLNLLTLNAAQLAKRSTGAEQHALEGLRSGAFRLDAMISDLTDATFLESPHFAIREERIDVPRLVNAQIALHAPGGTCSVDGEIPTIDADPRLAQVLTNLLVNARKHGRPGTSPRVAVARRAALVVVSVTSEGGGIAPDERTKIFEPYYRARDRQPGTYGMGLGLYICRLLIEAHGGRIWTDSDSLRTRFTFCLPILRSAPRNSEMRTVASREVSHVDLGLDLGLGLESEVAQ